MKNNITVREAIKEDAYIIAQIIVEDWQKAYRGIIDDDYLDSLDVNVRYEIEVKRYDKYIVASNDSEVLGCAWLEKTDDKDADCEIIALYVRYSERNNGIGKLLLNDAIARFSKDGRKRMVIWCLKDNLESRRFYEKVGGKESKTCTHNWGGKEYEMISYLYDIG